MRGVWGCVQNVQGVLGEVLDKEGTSLGQEKGVPFEYRVGAPFALFATI